jgi:CHAT domain-containing protein
VALASFQQALQLFRELKDDLMEYHTLRNIGRVYEAQAQDTQALRKYQQALHLSQPGTDERWKAYVHVDIGRLLQRKKQYSQSALHYGQALEFNRKTEDKLGASQTYYSLAQLSLDVGNLSEAETQIKQAVSIIESVRAKVIRQELRTSYFALVNQIFGLYTDILMQQHQRSPTGQFVKEALTVSEQSRARSLLDLLNESRHDIKQGADPKLLEQERSLQQTLNGKADRKLQLANQPGKEAELAAVSKEVDDLTMQLDDIRSKMRETSPRYAALTQPQPLKAAEIQQLLDDNTMLLEYALGDERSYLWAVTRDAIEAYTLPRRTTIEPLVREMVQLMTAPLQQDNETAAAWQRRVLQADQQYWPRAAELSQMVLGPVAAKLGQQRLVIVGDGALQLLPFAALPEPVVSGQLSVVSKNAKDNRQPTTDNRQPLIAAHELTSLPSASALKLLREDRVKPLPPRGWLARLRSWWGQEPASLHSVAVLADPVFEKDDKRVQSKEPTATQVHQPQTRDVDLSNENVFLPRLVATREEAAEIKKAAGANPFLLKQGFEVNRALLASEELNRYGVVHFATHGLWDSTNPELSVIFLSRFDRQGNKVDGTLRLSDIYNLTLPKELVVLSACETAVGKDVRGEGLIALTRGFMYAGAARVLASLWKVEDTATAEMMKIFYQRLLQDNLTPAAALRQAQIAMWRKEPDKAPYNWAAFVMQGEYR